MVLRARSLEIHIVSTEGDVHETRAGHRGAAAVVSESETQRRSFRSSVAYWCLERGFPSLYGHF